MPAQPAKTSWRQKNGSTFWVYVVGGVDTGGKFWVLQVYLKTNSDFLVRTRVFKASPWFLHLSPNYHYWINQGNKIEIQCSFALIQAMIWRMLIFLFIPFSMNRRNKCRFCSIYWWVRINKCYNIHKFTYVTIQYPHLSITYSLIFLVSSHK